MINWNRIENFVGYGAAAAPVVFVGKEEGLTAHRALADELDIRSHFESPIMDLREAQALLGYTQFLDPAHPRAQRTWRAMCHIALVRRGLASTPEARLSYQLYMLADAVGDELLIELLPYPHRRAAEWDAIYRKRFETRARYEAAMLPRRIKLLQEVIWSFRRDLVVCYGKQHWRDFAELVPEARWEYGVVPHASDFAKASVGTTTVVLLPHLSGRAFNSNDQLNAHMAALR